MAIISKKIHTSKPREAGFTLLIAVIFMGVVLAIGLALGSMSYKQAVLTSAALDSQKAFYAADAGLECVLRADEQDDTFNYHNYTPGATSGNVSCAGVTQSVYNLCYNGTPYLGNPLTPGFVGSCANEWIANFEVPLSFANPLTPTPGTEKFCAIITVYKPNLAVAGTKYTYLFSQGYSVPCNSVSAIDTRYASRGLWAIYQD